jgi:hypothetical protein
MYGTWYAGKEGGGGRGEEILRVAAALHLEHCWQCPLPASTSQHPNQGTRGGTGGGGTRWRQRGKGQAGKQAGVHTAAGCRLRNYALSARAGTRAREQRTDLGHQRHAACALRYRLAGRWSSGATTHGDRHKPALRPVHTSFATERLTRNTTEQLTAGGACALSCLHLADVGLLKKRGCICRRGCKGRRKCRGQGRRVGHRSKLVGIAQSSGHICFHPHDSQPALIHERHMPLPLTRPRG